MISERRRTPAAIWLERWRYLGAIAPSTVLLLIAAGGSDMPGLATARGFVRYMVFVVAFGLGAAVTRPLHHYLQHRFRPWQGHASFKYRQGHNAQLLVTALAPGIAIWAACLGLAVWAKAQGIWPWTG